MDDANEDYQKMISNISLILNNACKNNKGYESLLIIIFSSITEFVSDKIKNKNQISFCELLQIICSSINYNLHQINEILQEKECCEIINKITIHQGKT